MKRLLSGGIWVLIAAMILGILISKISVVFSAVDLFDTLERQMTDAHFHWRYAMNGQLKPADDPIVIVAADDVTERALNMRYPYSRAIWARAVDNLTAAGAKVIAFDILFTTPADTAGDRAFAEAIARSGKVLLCGELVYESSKFLSKTIITESPPDVRFTDTGVPWSLINMDEDIDKVQREYNLTYHVNDRKHFSLGVKSLLMYTDATVTPYEVSYQNQVATIGNFQIVAVDTTQMLINYGGPPQTYTTYSLSQVLDDATFDLVEGEDSDWMEFFLSEPTGEADSLIAAMAKDNPFRGKIVLIGNTMPALHDVKATPFDGIKAEAPLMPGVEVHAQAMGTILTNQYLHPIGFWIQFIGWFLLTAVVWKVGESKHIWMGVVVMFGAVIFITVITAWLFISFNLLADTIPPLATTSLAFTGTTLLRVLREQREKTRIKGMFGQYVPKKVVGELISNPGMLRLGGERRRLSVLFTDVAGFTSISENLEPEELVALLNEYLTAMTRVILSEDGIIDKYEGDLIMAEFGAPVHYTDHAIRACRAALRMQKKLAELREKWKEEGKPLLHSRVGLNTGDMIVGNMGSEDVFDYTVMGDAVNLASRLESVNKMYGTTIMCSSATREETVGKFHMRFLDRVRVMGKSQFVEIYEVLGEFSEPLPETQQKVVKLFEEGRAAYSGRDFSTALSKFRSALDVDPHDGPSKVFLRRTRMYLEHPPEEGWDGVFTLTEK